MSKNELEKIRQSIDLTLNQPGALFQLETKAEGITHSSYGIADFQNVSHTSKDAFEFSFPETVEDAPTETNEVISLFHQGEIFQLVEVDGSEKEWTVFETDDSGWSSSILAPLFWLKGVDQVQSLSSTHYQLSINMQQYVAKQPTVAARTQATQTLENSAIGLSTQTLSVEVKCDNQGRIEWLSVILPANTASEENPGIQEEQNTETTISLSFIANPPTIPKPDVNQRFSAIEFINSSVEQAKKALSEESNEDGNE